jgi:DNA-directed RNA polymerase subunit L
MENSEYNYDTIFRQNDTDIIEQLNTYNEQHQVNPKTLSAEETDNTLFTPLINFIDKDPKHSNIKEKITHLLPDIYELAEDNQIIIDKIQALIGFVSRQNDAFITSYITFIKKSKSLDGFIERLQTGINEAFIEEWTADAINYIIGHLETGAFGITINTDRDWKVQQSKKKQFKDLFNHYKIIKNSNAGLQQTMSPQEFIKFNLITTLKLIYNDFMRNKYSEFISTTNLHILDNTRIDFEIEKLQQQNTFYNILEELENQQTYVAKGLKRSRLTNRRKRRKQKTRKNKK